MAKTLSRSADAALYDEDFYVWTQRQAELLRKGRFTDLDVAHLIEEYRKGGLSFVEAVKKALKELEGHYALVMIAGDEPGTVRHELGGALDTWREQLREWLAQLSAIATEMAGMFACWRNDSRRASNSSMLAATGSVGVEQVRSAEPAGPRSGTAPAATVWR